MCLVLAPDRAIGVVSCRGIETKVDVDDGDEKPRGESENFVCQQRPWIV